jgi:hypothetical protein
VCYVKNEVILVGSCRHWVALGVYAISSVSLMGNICVICAFCILKHSVNYSFSLE